MKITAYKKILCALCLIAINVSAETFEQGQSFTEMGAVVPHRERVTAVNDIIKDRLDNLLPELMNENNLDMWVVIYREYGEDVLFYTLVPQPTFAARRTTMLVFNRNKETNEVERFSVSRYPIKGFYEARWKGGNDDSQWQKLAEIIEELDPQSIGINTSKDWALADGLTAGLHQQLLDSLNEQYQQRIVSAEELAIRWLETRSEKEQQIYPHIVGIARAVIAEAFSSKVITPGVTTTDDVIWFMRQRFEDLQVRPWFQPNLNLQRKGENNDKDAMFFGKYGAVIQPGDVLHTDVGICYLKLCTDTQEMGYVLNLGETDVPKGLKKALAVGNRWQNALTDQFKTGRTGNEIFDRGLAAAKKLKINASIYTHPIGFVGHGVGPTIGMWDNQGHTPIKGDWKLFPNTAYAIEGSIKTQVPEWDNEWIQISLEQTAIFDGDKVWYLAGRQTQWHIAQ